MKRKITIIAEILVVLSALAIAGCSRSEQAGEAKRMAAPAPENKPELSADKKQQVDALIDSLEEGSHNATAAMTIIAMGEPAVSYLCTEINPLGDKEEKSRSVKAAGLIILIGARSPEMADVAARELVASIRGAYMLYTFAQAGDANDYEKSGYRVNTAGMFGNMLGSIMQADALVLSTLGESAIRALSAEMASSDPILKYDEETRTNALKYLSDEQLAKLSKNARGAFNDILQEVTDTVQKNGGGATAVGSSSVKP